MEIKYLKFKDKDNTNLSTTKFLDCDNIYHEKIKHSRDKKRYNYSLPNFTEIKLKSIKNSLIKTGSYYYDKSKNDEKSYDCKQYIVNELRRVMKMPSEKNVLPLFYGAGESFQHFMMHVYPVLVTLTDYLKSNNDIKIALYKPEFDSFDYLVKKLDIENKFIFLKPGQKILCENSISTELLPYQPYCYITPKIVRETWKILQEESISNQEYLIYMGRKNGRNRRDRNHEDVVKYLKQFSEEKNLKFINFNHSDYSVEDRFNLFRKAKIVIYIHGGAGYNIYFCQKDTLVIEINWCFSMKECGLPYDNRKPNKGETLDCLEYIANPIGFNFYCVVGKERENKYSTKVTVPLEKIKMILNERPLK